jgi:hypothetical protein
MSKTKETKETKETCDGLNHTFRKTTFMDWLNGVSVCKYCGYELVYRE